jgi:hypothetical protein
VAGYGAASCLLDWDAPFGGNAPSVAHHLANSLGGSGDVPCDIGIIGKVLADGAFQDCNAVFHTSDIQGRLHPVNKTACGALLQATL